MPYIGKTTDGFGVRNRFVYLASADDTSVSGADANGATLTFTDGAYVDVYLNGVLLKPTTDYNTSTANTIAGLSALNTNDEVTVVVYDIFTVADMVSATSGGTFSGNVTFNGDISVGDDVSLASDGAVLGFGADNEITVTHVADTGLLLNDKLSISTSDNDDHLELISTDADAGGGPALRFYRNSSSPADDDTMTTIRFEGNNDAGQVVVYNRMRADISDASDGTEDGVFHIFNMMNGTERTMFSIKPDEVVFNEEGQDVNFRIESPTYGNNFTVNADTGNIAIGFATATFATGRGLHMTDDFHLGFGAGNGTRPDFQLGYDGTNTRLSLKCGTGSDDSDAIITTGGRFGIGITNTSARVNIQFAHSASEQGIRITPDSTTATMMRFDNSSGTEVGTITSSGSSTAYNTSSDYRLKENVSYDWDATSRLKQLKPARFNWIDDDTNTLVDGFIAHEVSSIVPESITGDKDATQDIGTVKNSEGKVVNEGVPKGLTDTENGETWTKTGTENVYQSIDQSKLVPLLVKTIQELEARVATLEEA